jgi:release factor glutamine methyltransferase
MTIIPGLKNGASIEEAVRLVAQSFKSAGIEDAAIDARILTGHALHLDRSQLLSQSARLLDGGEIDAIVAIAARRLAHEPVSRILGRRAFWDLDLRVSPDVLVPRPETETVVEAALDFIVRNGLRLEKLRVLDIGTGTGALLLALLRELPNAVGTGTDLSEAAIAVAHSNADRNKLSGRAQFVVCNMADGIRGPFDLIVSNPPYIPHADIATLMPEVRNHDPLMALDGGADGLDAYRAIARGARRLLAPGGRLIVELGIGQKSTVGALFLQSGLTVRSTRADLAGIPRALVAHFSSIQVS